MEASSIKCIANGFSSSGLAGTAPSTGSPLIGSVVPSATRTHHLNCWRSDTASGNPGHLTSGSSVSLISSNQDWIYTLSTRFAAGVLSAGGIMI